jgi:hypothetical protein
MQIIDIALLVSLIINVYVFYLVLTLNRTVKMLSIMTDNAIIVSEKLLETNSRLVDVISYESAE